MAPEVNKRIGRLHPDARTLAAGGLVAALYVALTGIFAPISFGMVQFRVAEILTLLPVLAPVSVPGLFVGCLLSNLLFGAPWQDVLFGSLATLLAAYLTRLLRKDLWLAALMPVLCNGLVVGSMLAAVYGLPWLASMGFVALGEAGVCYVLGVPMVRLLQARLGDTLGRF
ncbi:MAG: QueT transporter family protein [Christensenellales bacterium]